MVLSKARFYYVSKSRLLQALSQSARSGGLSASFMSFYLFIFHL